MKTLKLILLSFFLFPIALVYGQEKQLPNKQETITYFENLLKEAIGFDYQNKNNANWKLASVSFSSWSYHREWDNNDNESEKKSFKYNTKRTDYSKVISIVDAEGLFSLQGLMVNFEPNTITEDKHIYMQNFRNGKWQWHWEYLDQSMSSVLIFYKNTPGTRERLLKALEHLVMLSKKEKDEEKKNDPFGN